MESRVACEVCGGGLKEGLAFWHRRCRQCGLETAAFTAHIDDRVAEDLDEDQRELALRPIREANFDTLLNWLLGKNRFHGSTTRPRLLDVGCAHGWFLEKAAPHFEVTGIEPDPEVFKRTAARGLPVLHGYFPDALGEGETFDVIVFNDVLEHIPGVIAALRECNKRLREGGMVVVNAPDRRGMLYWIARMMARIGLNGPFDRMWQKGLPSPHLYYFDTESLSTAAKAAGLDVSDSVRLPSLFARGLYSRIRFSGDVSRLKAVLIAAGVLPLVPLLKVLPSDITVWSLVRNPSRG